jgi:hypothetical protein
MALRRAIRNGRLTPLQLGSSEVRPKVSLSAHGCNGGRGGVCPEAPPAPVDRTAIMGTCEQRLLKIKAFRVDTPILTPLPAPASGNCGRGCAGHGTGRQSYRQVQVIQLMLWALELTRTVWRMPLYRWALRAPRALHAPQMRLFD